MIKSFGILNLRHYEAFAYSEQEDSEHSKPECSKVKALILALCFFGDQGYGHW